MSDIWTYWSIFVSVITIVQLGLAMFVIYQGRTYLDNNLRMTLMAAAVKLLSPSKVKVTRFKSFNQLEVNGQCYWYKPVLPGNHQLIGIDQDGTRFELTSDGSDYGFTPDDLGLVKIEVRIHDELAYIYETHELITYQGAENHANSIEFD
jgi:hypothetical protein